MTTARILGLVAGAAMAATASAAPTFFVSVGDQLIVRTGAMQQQFSLTDNLTSMTVTPSGDVIGTSPSDDGNGTYELYRIDNPTTAPTLTLLGDFLSRNTPSLTYVGGTLYGIQADPSGSPPSRLVTIDIGAQSESIVGQSGDFALNSAGSGYDASTDTFFVMDKGNPGNLYDLDYAVTAPSDPTAALIGPLGVPVVNHAGEFFGGALYGVVQSGAGGTLIDVRLGTINTGAGTFSETALLLDDFDFSTLKDSAPSIGLAIIPSPGSAAVLGLAALGLTRRRR